MPPIRILEILTKGVVITYSITIPEGFTLEQIADVLAKNELVEKESVEEYKQFKEIILSEKPKTQEEYIDALFRHFGEEYYENRFYLTDLLNEKGFELEL